MYVKLDVNISIEALSNKWKSVLKMKQANSKRLITSSKRIFFLNNFVMKKRNNNNSKGPRIQYPILNKGFDIPRYIRTNPLNESINKKLNMQYFIRNRKRNIFDEFKQPS